MKMNRKDLMELLEIGYQAKRPYFIWGSMGIGKSYTVKKFAKKKAEELGKEFVEWNNLTTEEKKKVFENLDGKFLFIDLRASEINLDDFKIPKLDGDYFEWKIPMVFALICQKDAEGILFFDEFNLARPNIQSMFYQLINDRQIGEHRLSDGIYVIGAGNNAEDSNAVFEMSKPLLDRFEHIELDKPTLEEWTEWAIENDVDTDIVAFINFKPSALFYPTDDSKSFATPRGWEYFSKAYKLVKDKKDFELIGKLGWTFVGGFGLEFSSFVKLKININVRDIIQNPELVKNYKTPDMLYTIISALIDYARENLKDTDRLNSVAKAIDMAPVEFSVFGFRFLTKLEKGILNKIKSVDFSKYLKYLV